MAPARFWQETAAPASRRAATPCFCPAGPHACGMLDVVPPESSSTDPLDAYSAAVVGAVDEVGPAVVSVYVGGAAEAARARGGAGSGADMTPHGYSLRNQHRVH